MDKNTIKITKKTKLKGEDGTKVISVRVKDELLQKIDSVAQEAERSRNELINILLENSIDKVIIE